MQHLFSHNVRFIFKVAHYQKYGKSMNRSDLSRRQWLVHAQEEAMDLAIYLEKLIQEEPESL